MKKDYDRIICNECNFKETCEEYRNKFRCIECHRTLLCFVKGENNHKRCNRARGEWRTLSKDCALARELMQSGAEITLSRFSGFIIKDYGRECPRCSQATFVIYPTLIQYEIKNQRHVPMYAGDCEICRLHVEVIR